MQRSRTYIAVFATLAIVVPGIVASINVAIDPWGYFGTRLIAGFNVLKPEMGFYEKELKAHRLASLRPEGLILGSSASDVGLDPEHPGWSAETAYNLSAGQSSISLTHHLLLHAMEFRVPKQIVLGLEMGMFNPAKQVVQGLNPASLAVLDDGERNREYLGLNFYANAFSLDMLSSAVKAYAANRENRVEPGDQKLQISATGMMDPETFPQSRWKGFRQSFQRMVTLHVESFWAPPELFTAIDDFTTNPAFRAYQNILRLACDNDIELYVVLSPGHAYLLEAQEAVNLTAVWERWKRAIVAAASEQANSATCSNITLWDFSGYNEVTTEEIAANRKPADAPQWYWDPVHYTTGLGDEMLNRVFELGSESEFSDFGVRLTPENIDDLIEAGRTQGERYRNTHAAEVAVVNKTVETALKTESK